MRPRLPRGPRAAARFRQAGVGAIALACLAGPWACQSPLAPTLPPGPALPQAPAPARASSDPADVTIDASKIAITPPRSGAVRVSGAAGAVPTGTPAVSLAVMHDLQRTYRTRGVLHLGSTFLVALVKVGVAADGSFAETIVGDSSRNVQSGDKLYVYPYQSESAPYGTPAILVIP